MISAMDQKIQSDIADEADPYRVDIKALSQAEASTPVAEDEDSDDIINDENVSVTHLAKLQKMALAEEAKLEAEAAEQREKEKQRQVALAEAEAAQKEAKLEQEMGTEGAHAMDFLAAQAKDIDAKKA